MTQLDISHLVRSDFSRLVAVEPGVDGRATLYRRREDGHLEEAECDFHPWLLVAGEALAQSLPNVSQIIPLHGQGSFKYRVCFPNLAAYDEARKQLRLLTGFQPSSAQAPYRIFSDMTQQLLTMLPARLFRDLTFSELRRLQLDIETRTVGQHRFPDATRPDDAVIMVAMKDSTGWEECLVLDEKGEKALLEKMIDLVQERDPDVIEGHNIFNFDLDYLEKRCRRHKVKLALGRGRREVQIRSSRFTAAERTAALRRFDVFGRHVIDTYHLVQLHDVSSRDMESYGLKAAAIHFGVAAPNRTYVDGSQITEVFAQNPERLREYSLDDVRETDALAKILSPSYFHQAQLVPLSYQNCVLRGNAARIDALLCAEYMLASASLPLPEASMPFAGGLTASAQPGVFQHVWHVDVRSLYPSIILAEQLTPSNDHLGVFRQLLGNLRDFRLAAKDGMRNASPEAKEQLNALQGSFKILINSFYGYTGFGQGTFNDFGMAEKVTATGREILSRMHDFLLQAGAFIIEMDTDGIYFTPPPGVTDMESMRQQVQAVLPPGIEVELDASYKAMFCYKSKNYALLGWDDRVFLTGAALKSRGLEPFQRNYMREHIELLLKGKAEEVDLLYEKYIEDIEQRKLPLKDFAKREILSTPPNVYAEKLQQKQTRRSAAYELVLQAKQEYNQGDMVEFYVIGNRKNVSVTGNSRLLEDAIPNQRDENIPYYLEKLRQLRQKFTLPE